MNLKEKINYLEKHGVTFVGMNKKEAKQQLKQEVNFFELLEYLQNYEQDARGRALGADIAYLISMNRIDLSLRKVIIDLCLDLEYELKKTLSYYFDMHPEAYEECLQLSGKDVENQIRKTIHYLEENEKHTTTNVILNMHFYPLIHLYRCYGERIHSRTSENEFYCLLNCKDLRNDCAHNQSLLTNFRPSKEPFAQSYEVLQEVASIIPSKQLRKKRMANETINDLACLFYLYPRIIENEQFLSEARQKLYDIEVMMTRHVDMYQDTELITSSLQFLIKLIDNFIKSGTIEVR